jgi:hypothetical protein
LKGDLLKTKRFSKKKNIEGKKFEGKKISMERYLKEPRPIMILVEH